MRIVVDYDLCETNEICTQIAPEVFQVGDDERMHILNDRPGEELRHLMQEAVRRCPKQALSLVEE